MGSVLGLRQVRHWLRIRICVRVLLCWFVLLLVRVTATGHPRPFARLHVVAITVPAGDFRQSSELCELQQPTPEHPVSRRITRQ
jgi:hypothetical protein